MSLNLKTSGLFEARLNTEFSINSITFSIFCKLRRQTFIDKNHVLGWTNTCYFRRLGFLILEYFEKWKIKNKLVQLSFRHRSAIARYTVKLARAKLPAMAAGKDFRRWNYLQMQAKFSAGNDCLRFRQVTGGNLPAPAGNLTEAFKVLVRIGFSNLGTFPFTQYLTTWPK